VSLTFLPENCVGTIASLSFWYHQKKIANMNQEACGLALPSRMSGQSSFHAHEVTLNSVLLGRANALDMCRSPAFELAGMVVSTSLLETFLSDLFADRFASHLTLRN
jgi:hypothetical protein